MDSLATETDILKAAEEWKATQVVDVAYRLERDLWRDTSRLVARLCDIRG